jgi:hypothetical protein
VPQINDNPPGGWDVSDHVRRAYGSLNRLAATLGAGNDGDDSDDGDEAEMAQESLDFLAMAAKLKPVYLLGRGFGRPEWIEGVRAIARELKCEVIEGALWDAAPLGDEFPDWYRDHTSAELARRTAHYITNSAAIADELRLIAAGARLTVAIEARLLGFPECCVAAHYGRTLGFHRLSLAMFARATGGDAGGDEGGDAADMARLLREAAPLAPANSGERAALDAATSLIPCPFTSLNMCETCAASARSPAAALALSYAGLAHHIDPDFARRIADIDPAQP